MHFIQYEWTAIILKKKKKREKKSAHPLYSVLGWRSGANSTLSLNAEKAISNIPVSWLSKVVVQMSTHTDIFCA